MNSILTFSFFLAIFTLQVHVCRGPSHARLPWHLNEISRRFPSSATVVAGLLIIMVQLTVRIARTSRHRKVRTPVRKAINDRSVEGVA